MTERTPAAPETSSKLPIERPLHCGRCGYATEGLHGNTCPECGFDLTRTPFLRWADRGWLRTIVVGSELVQIGSISALVFKFGGSTILGIVSKIGVSLPIGPKVLASFLTMGSLAAAAIGAWLLAAPDPSLHAEADGRFSRRTIYRGGIVVALVLVAIRAWAGPWLHPVVS